MEPIQIVFFVLGSFFGIADSAIQAEKTDVYIDTDRQIITASLHNLVAGLHDELDSMVALDELRSIGNPSEKDKHQLWSREFDRYTWKMYDIISDQDAKQLHAKIELKYNTEDDLRGFAIDYVEEEGSYAMINIPSWNIETRTGELRGNYWYFKEKITFSLSPDIPDQYKKSLYPIWEEINP